jgi:tetratricopeptide (TPR) repeat protein
MYKVVLAFNWGVLMEEKCDYPAALEYYQESIALNPFSIDSYTRLAYLQYKLGNNEDCLNTLEEGRRQFDNLMQMNKFLFQVYC